MKYMKGTLKVVLITLLRSRPKCLSNILSVNVKCPFYVLSPHHERHLNEHQVHLFIRVSDSEGVPIIACLFLKLDVSAESHFSPLSCV